MYVESQEALLEMGAVSGDCLTEEAVLCRCGV